MPVYPQSVAVVLEQGPSRARIEASLTGRAASFECGCFVEIDLDIRDRVCRDGSIRTNGCGYMVASAGALLDQLCEMDVRDLRGLGDSELIENIGSSLELGCRKHCFDVCVAALREGFQAFREKTVAEYAGESALICSCFGVSEEAIVNLLASMNNSTVEAVSNELLAGRGCGSCRGIIADIIDNYTSTLV